MIYLFGVFIPLLLQSLLVFITIQMNTGNGSWAGLGALLIGMFAIPATAIANFVYARSNRDKHPVVVVGNCLAIAMILPFAILLLMFVG